MAEKKSKKGLTRRSFLKRTGIAGAGLAAAGPASKLLGNKSLDALFGPDTAEAEAIGEHGGYAGKILHVDLGGGNGGFQTWTEPTKKYAKKFLGDRGISEWLIFNHVPLGADALGPENIMVFGAGILVGTLMQAASRLNVCTINALTGGSSHSSSGGHFAPEMKYAGYDNIVIRGKANSPSYLFINDDMVELRDASHIWGKTTWEADEIIREELGDKRIRTLAIGIAGENLIRHASINVGRSQNLGGRGCGAVMGSKNLKAIAVRGHGKIKIADPENFKIAVDEYFEANQHMRRTEPWHTYCMYPTVRRSSRNGQRSDWPSVSWKAPLMSQAVFDELGWTGRQVTCFNCLRGCFTFYNPDTDLFPKDPSVENQTTLIGFRMISTSVAASLDISPDPLDFVKFKALCDTHAIDMIGICGLLGWAYECYQRGLITQKDTGGLKLVWEDNKTLFKAMEAVCHREGKLGNLLAEGGVKACQKLGDRVDADGHTPEYYLWQNLGADHKCSGRGRRYARRKWILGIYTALRGGKHSDGASGGLKYTDDFTADERNGGLWTGAGKNVSYKENCNEINDCCGLCFFMSAKIYKPEDVARVLNHATGSNLTGDDLLQIGSRIYNIEKAINTLRRGFTREDLEPQARLLVPLPEGDLSEGECVDIDLFDEALDEYLELRGWDKDSSWQKKKTLIDLGLPGVAWALWNEGKLK